MRKQTKATRVLIRIEEREVGDDAIGSWKHVESVVVRIKQNDSPLEAMASAYKELLCRYGQ